MSSEQREYSGWLGVRLTSEAASSIHLIAARAGLEIEIADTYLEFAYAGPDSNQFVVSFLQELAPFIGCADGEIRCEIVSDNEDDPQFEFYRFRDGSLIRQRARLVRGPPEIVADVQAPDAGGVAT